MIRRPYTTLIVDDEEEICFLIKSMLEKKYSNILDVVTATSGKQAMEIIATRSIHILITDLAMPDLSGFDIVTLLKSKNSWAQSIIITGSSQLVTVLTCFRDGASLFIEKPFPTDKFGIYMDNIIERFDLWAEAFKIPIES